MHFVIGFAFNMDRCSENRKFWGKKMGIHSISTIIAMACIAAIKIC